MVIAGVMPRAGKSGKPPFCRGFAIGGGEQRIQSGKSGVRGVGAGGAWGKQNCITQLLAWVSPRWGNTPVH